ncbi:hypothetical protein Ocin01_16624 [Orchesella cincta]|uniref:F-box domain-containing protein n=1 Tax=Orchesella cincta TaxID=48709 RepID=A0A1D2MAP2_ORCCI|nr:hypothetical protein Ocin01_16624 [Orchesella cincta]
MFTSIVERLKSHLPPANESFQTSLPPELVELILERVTDHNTLLHCRLICVQWKHIVDSLLEKRRLSLVTNWNPAWNAYTNIYLNIYSKCLNPCILAVSPKNTSDNVLILPLALKRRKFKWNPFPQKCIAIVPNTDVDEVEDRKSEEKRNFLRLKYCFNISQNDLISIFGALLSLKSILFSKVCVNEKPSSRTDINISPYLTHLHMLNINGWDLDTLVNYLATLIEKTEFPPPLEYLSVIPHPWSNVDRMVKHAKYVMNLISKIPSSLTCLRMVVHVDTMLNFLEISGVIFPNVTMFEMLMFFDYFHPPPERHWEETYLKEMISPAFPKLKTVKIITFNDGQFVQPKHNFIKSN